MAFFLNKYSRLAIACTLLLFGSCNKETDDLPPVINFILPYENAAFDSGEEINIKAVVSDNENIAGLKISLLTESFLPVVTVYNKAHDVRNVELQISFIPENNLQAAYYYLKIEACDKENCTSAFRKIYLDAYAEKFSHLLVLSKPALNTVKVSAIDSVLNLIPIFNVSSDFSESALSKPGKKLYIMGEYTGDLNVYDAIDNSFSWKVQSVPSPPFKYFSGLNLSEGLAYVGMRNSELRIYRDNGQYLNSFQTPSGTYPVGAYSVNNYLILELKQIGLPDNLIAVYQKPGYLLIQTYMIPINLVNLYSYGNDKVFVFGNDAAGNSLMREYSISGNSMQNIYNMPTKTLVAVEEISNGKYFIAFSDEVAIYQYSVNSLIPVLSGISPRKIIYEALSGRFIVAGNGFINVYSYPQFALLGSVTLTDSLLNIHAVYN